MTEYIIIAQYKMITVLQNFTASVNVKLCFRSAAPSLFHNTHCWSSVLKTSQTTTMTSSFCLKIVLIYLYESIPDAKVFQTDWPQYYFKWSLHQSLDTYLGPGHNMSRRMFSQPCSLTHCKWYWNTLWLGYMIYCAFSGSFPGSQYTPLGHVYCKLWCIYKWICCHQMQFW